MHWSIICNSRAVQAKAHVGRNLNFANARKFKNPVKDLSSATCHTTTWLQSDRQAFDVFLSKRELRCDCFRKLRFCQNFSFEDRGVANLGTSLRTRWASRFLFHPGNTQVRLRRYHHPEHSSRLLSLSPVPYPRARSSLLPRATGPRGSFLSALLSVIRYPPPRVRYATVLENNSNSRIA